MNLAALLSLAAVFLKQAQIVSAQPADLQTALKNAGLWELSADIAVILSALKVPDDTQIQLSIIVKKDLSVDYSVLLSPTNPILAGKLRAALLQRYAARMTLALRQAKLHLADAMVLNWLKF